MKWPLLLTFEPYFTFCGKKVHVAMEMYDGYMYEMWRYIQWSLLFY